MTILLTILALIALAILGLLAYAATKPNTFRYERHITINAPAATIFPLINDFRRWTEWSPYEHRDPKLKRTYGHPAAGVGGSYAWEGDKSVGSGRMDILEAPPPERVKIRLQFFKPFVGDNIADFTLREIDGATDVSWAMYGPQPFMTKVMSSVINFDKMIGNDFDTGLANMKAVAERG